MKSERPILLTFICIAGFVSCSLSTIFIYAPEVLNVGKVYAFFRSIYFASLAVCFGGFWMMRRWAVWAFAACFVTNQLVCLTFRTWDTHTLLPMLLFAVAVFYHKRMK